MSYRKKHIGPKIRGLKKRKRLVQRPLFWLALLVVLVGGGIFYLLFFLPGLQVSSIVILGNQQIPTQDIENTVNSTVEKGAFSILLSKSIFWVDPKKINQNLLKDFVTLESANVQKQFPKTLVITVKERAPVAVFCAQLPDQNCFLIDSHGLIYQSLFQTPSNMVTIASLPAQTVAIGDSTVSQNIMDTILKIQKNLKDRFELNIKEALITDSLVITTSENWPVYFDASGDIGLQLTKLDYLLKDQIPVASRKKLHYIYLQYQDKAYYK